MENYYRNLKIVQLLIKWRMHLAILIGATILLSIIFSGPMFIKPRFKSFAIVYPANVLEYSDESLTEQMLQIMHSNNIRDSIIQKFNLIDHYRIDTTKEAWQSALYWTYDRNIKISKTQYEAVMIDVMDIDRTTACDIVNGILHYYNLKVGSLHHEKFAEVVRMYVRHLRRKELLLDSLQKRMEYLGTTYGVLDYEFQSPEVAKGFLRTVQGGGNINTAEVLKTKKNMEEKGGEMVMVTELIKQEAMNYAEIKKDYDRAVMDQDRRYTYANIITHPQVADKKSYPVRWIIVVLSSLAVLFVSIIGIGIIENSKLVKQENQ